MSKIIIDNQSSASDLDAIEAVKAVMKKGRISNDGKQYCYFALLNVYEYPLSIGSFLNKKSDRFVVMDNRTGKGE